MIRALVEDLIPRVLSPEELAYRTVLPARDASFGSLDPPLPELLQEALADQGIVRLFAHQAQGIARVRSGEHLIVATPTASGKSFIYTLPVLETLLEDPEARALYLFPLKALEQDQLGKLKALGQRLGFDPRAAFAVYDGDTSPYRRRKIRSSPPAILISNPDMVHLGILAYHGQWERFLRGLRYLVLDELHTYRGIFGSHMVQILRRLRRVARFYGADPQIIAASATIGNPREFAERLTGLPFSVVEESTAPRREQHILFVNPTDSPYTTATRLFLACLEAGLKTIVFTKARKITELVYTWSCQQAPHLADKISSYRAGFLPEERREIEARMFRGELHGVVSTSALELGIDIGGLDACILAGYPGTITSTWQRGGRVGRGDRDSAILLVAQPDALDQYFMTHPEDFFRRGYEAAVLDPENRQVVAAHLVCAAAELPLRAGEGELDPERYHETVEQLEAGGQLLRSARGREWFSARRYPQRGVNVRSVGERYAILDAETGGAVGEVSGGRAFHECHRGAVYLHRGRQYLVEELDLDRRDIAVREVEVDYFTRVKGRKETEILEVFHQEEHGLHRLGLGRLKVTEWVEAYEKRRILGQESLGVEPLDLPPQIFETIGCWLELDEAVPATVEAKGLHFMGAIHAAEHGAIALFPLVVLCDREDLGGISYSLHPQLRRPGIFFYDGHPGGVGITQAGAERMEDLLRATTETIQRCPCEEGCPSCIHSPKCGSGNKPLDKSGALLVLRLLLGEEEPFRERAARVEVAPLPGPPPAEVVENEVVILPRGRAVYFDLETQRSAEEVGGWEYPYLMRMAVGVVYDEGTGEYATYGEGEVDRLLDHLGAADLVVGFNIRRFDYGVLKGYAGGGRVDEFTTFDILEDLHRRLGFRVSLAHLVRATLGEEKGADGLQSLTWWKEGRVDQVIEYCRQDVALTRALFRFGLDHGYLLMEREGVLMRLPAGWRLEAT